MHFSFAVKGSNIIWIFLFIGICFVAVSVLGYKMNSDKEARCDATTVATVIDYVESASDSGYHYYPVFTYTVGDQEYTGQHSVGTNPPSYRIGEQVTIRYNSSDPWESVVEGDSTATILFVIFLVLGIVFTAVGAVLLVMKLTGRLWAGF